MTYTLDGGNSTMDGSVGSLSFTNAAWALTATADPSQVETGSAALLNTYFLPTTVTLSISDSVNGVTSMSLNDFTDYKWGVFTSDFGPISFGGFGAWDTRQQSSFQSDAAFVVTGDPGLYSNLGTAGSWNGGQTGYAGLASPGLTNFETSIGTLHLTVETGVSPTGKFEIVGASVPDKGSTAALLGAGLFVLAAARRRLG
ncbi:VPDSG-CTERM sorting domain-containing protein [Opitutaceae bacterium]|nr:VPDSG-CTERM sorting domain-containing protein [Opitutaceae bacterium]